MKNMLRRLRSIIGRGHPRLHWLTDDIAFSAAPSAESWERVREAGIACVLDLRSESPDARQEVEAAGLRYLRLPVGDGAPPSDEALGLLARWIASSIEEHGPVLVHCREGRGRSPMVACAGLIQLGFPLADAFKALIRTHQDIALSEEQIDALERFAGKLGRRAA